MIYRHHQIIVAITIKCGLKLKLKNYTQKYKYTQQNTLESAHPVNSIVIVPQPYSTENLRI